jgi:Sigma-70, region 4
MSTHRRSANIPWPYPAHAPEAVSPSAGDVELTYYHDLSYAEIAAIAGCPVNTVKTRMARARYRLAQQLAAQGLASATVRQRTTSRHDTGMPRVTQTASEPMWVTRFDPPAPCDPDHKTFSSRAAITQ